MSGGLTSTRAYRFPCSSRGSTDSAAGSGGRSLSAYSAQAGERFCKRVHTAEGTFNRWVKKTPNN